MAVEYFYLDARIGADVLDCAVVQVHEELGE